MKKVALAAAAMILLAAQCSPAMAKQARIVPGDVVLDRTEQLTSEIPWNSNLAQAEAQAKKQGKMIFWLQMLGDIRGTT